MLGQKSTLEGEAPIGGGGVELPPPNHKSTKHCAIIVNLNTKNVEMKESVSNIDT